MKNIIYKIVLLIIAPLVLVSCEDDAVLATFNSNASVNINLSTTAVTLNADNADLEALTISWAKPDFGFNAAPEYKVLVDNVGDNFSSPEVVQAGTALQKVLTVAELNGILLKLELEQGVATDVEMKVIVEIGDYNSIDSNVMTLNAIAYQDLLDLSTTWGVIGSAANDWGATPDLPFYQTGTANVYVAYVNLIDGEIKFRENNAWDNNYGDTGADGTLDAGGDNIAVSAGTYKITMNLSALTYDIESFSWGLVGSATTNGWDGPDMPLEYDPFSDTWRAIVSLVDGDVKVRKNNDWTVNYGDTGADGILDDGGDNIVAAAGTYLVTVNFNDLAYTFEPIDVFGLVGSATPNGWDGPDTKFKLDFSQDDVWYINNMVLIDGDLKFRLNDAWDVNYGDTGADGTLEEGGDNIVVTAGTYNIVLDFSNPNSPVYTIE